MTKEELETKYPGVEYAYPIAVASYDLALRRLDAIDGRLQTIMAFIVAVSAVVPSVAVPRGIHFRSCAFYAALGVFVVTLTIGTVARLYGKIKVFTPKKAFNHWLHKGQWTFKRDFISVAADDFESNNWLIKFKWWCMVVVSLLFFVQAVCLTVWVTGSF